MTGASFGGGGNTVVVMSGSEYGAFVNSENEVSGVLDVLPVAAYHATPLAVGNNQFVEFQCDANGNLKTYTSGSYGGFVNPDAPVSGVLNVLPVANYRTTPPTLANNQFVDLQCNVNGNLKTFVSGTYGGFVLGDSPVSGVMNTLPVFQYNSSSLVLTNRHFVAGQVDSSGFQKTAEQYGPAAEDNSNGVLATVNKPLAVSTYTPTVTGTLGGQGKGFVKASAGNLLSFRLDATNSAFTGSCWFQLHNLGAAPTTNAVPIAGSIWPVGTGSATHSKIVVGADLLTSNGENFSTGIAWGLSSLAGKFKQVLVAGDANTILKFWYK